MSDADSQKQIKLTSSDDKTFTVSRKVISQSKTITDIIQNLGIEESGSTSEDTIPLQKVTSTILEKIITWCEHHADDEPKKVDENKKTVDISEWDAEFMKVDQGTLFEIILAANYLDIRGLLDVTTQNVANMMKGKTPSQIRTLFNIENDFSEEEREAMKKENAWCED
ncbi:Skp1-related protein [Caenorhabditis elegans]|uniref:Skp1-related protein n=1 Tax=Caenorhabditis elegans TaxID=6239 RepID=G5EE67_CAEEL|nr:Skp1-related protein [Caenorhabditis elegans]AAL34095.1 SKR-3 [Caenorhabditis elegans]CAB05516.1 Skp1-related protein [Caenorhabditis elegans]|eukprot:NP_507059.1 SKp1 Related (ubiquitin ligase complex component) [Caenorhabditis elegans]